MTPAVTLLVRWVEMVFPLIGAGEPDEAIATALAWQIRADLVDHPDHDDVCDLLAQFSAAILAWRP